MAEKTLITIKRVCFVFCWNILDFFFANSVCSVWSRSILFAAQWTAKLFNGRPWQMICPASSRSGATIGPLAKRGSDGVLLCRLIVTWFYVLTGYSQANYKDKDNTGDFGRTTQAYASLCIRAFAARILKAGMKMQFLSKIQAYFHYRAIHACIKFNFTPRSRVLTHLYWKRKICNVF